MATKLTKPVSREVDVSGNRVVVSLTEEGVGFKLHGKRTESFVDFKTLFQLVLSNDDVETDEQVVELKKLRKMFRDAGLF